MEIYDMAKELECLLSGARGDLFFLSNASNEEDKIKRQNFIRAKLDDALKIAVVIKIKSNENSDE